MKLLSALAFASWATAAPQKRAPSPLNVELGMVGNSEVKATVTNTGESTLKLFKTGTFLDTAPVEKAHVVSNGQTVEFDGVRLTISTDHLDNEAFEVIEAGESVEVTFDIAELHDLSTGGKFEIFTAGSLSYAEEDSTELTGSIEFESNTLEAEVDGEEASMSRILFHQKRTRVQSDCTGSRLTATTNALRNCASLAQLGQQGASSGAAAKMVEFFKSSSASTRNTVASVFSRVRSECGSTNGGASRWFCSDVYGACSGGVLAYTLPSASYMAYCPLFFNNMPAHTTGCRTQTQANTALHETTHLREIAGTEDFGGYGYNFVRSLSAAQNLRHADTYTLFAQSLYANC